MPSIFSSLKRGTKETSERRRGSDGSSKSGQSSALAHRQASTSGHIAPSAGPTKTILKMSPSRQPSTLSPPPYAIDASGRYDQPSSSSERHHCADHAEPPAFHSEISEARIVGTAATTSWQDPYARPSPLLTPPKSPAKKHVSYQVGFGDQTAVVRRCVDPRLEPARSMSSSRDSSTGSDEKTDRTVLTVPHTTSVVDEAPRPRSQGVSNSSDAGAHAPAPHQYSRVYFSDPVSRKKGARFFASSRQALKSR